MKLEQAAGFVALARSGIDREFPNKTGHVITGADDLRTPREMHPVFFGHFDWHSSVHGHWTLVRLLRLFPDAPFAAETRSLLDGRFQQSAFAAEAGYFQHRENRSFERMYGWAWLLRLAGELRTWDDASAREWAVRMQPLEQIIVDLIHDYLPKLAWPVRCGFHPESSFALGQILDFARAAGDARLDALVRSKAIAFYGGDRNYPAAYEPSGNDFFSPGLNVADLMRRVHTPDEYSLWLDAYLPELRGGRAGNLLTPVTVGDPTDGQLIHLAGLNLSRAWTMCGAASALDGGDPRREVLENAAALHREAGLQWINSGHYEGDHWLGSFAVYLLTGVGR